MAPLDLGDVGSWPRHRVFSLCGERRNSSMGDRRRVASLSLARGHLRVLMGGRSHGGATSTGGCQTQQHQLERLQRRGRGGQGQGKERKGIQSGEAMGSAELSASSIDSRALPRKGGGDKKGSGKGGDLGKQMGDNAGDKAGDGDGDLCCSSSTKGSWMMKVVPAMPDEDMVDVYDSVDDDGSMNVQEQILSVIGASCMAPLYSTQIPGNRTLYWVATIGLQINERAERETGIGGICGDAVIVHQQSKKLKHGSDDETDISNVSLDREEENGGAAEGQKHEDGFKNCSEQQTTERNSSQHTIAPRGPTMESLPLCVIQLVFSQLTFTEICTASAVCKAWRQYISEDQHMLRSLDIRRRPGFELRPPLSLMTGNARDRIQRPSIGRGPTTHQRLPFILTQAAGAGNVKAAVLVAEELDSQGQRSDALEWWRKAAKKGHQESQYKVGEAFYRGDGIFARDGEEALLWLLRAVRNPNGENKFYAAADLLLGYMHLDGEGVNRSNTEAVKWFRLAAELGSLEAEKALGWLWNTGQY